MMRGPAEAAHGSTCLPRARKSLGRAVQRRARAPAGCPSPRSRGWCFDCRVLAPYFAHGRRACAKHVLRPTRALLGWRIACARGARSRTGQNAWQPHGAWQPHTQLRQQPHGNRRRRFTPPTTLHLQSRHIHRALAAACPHNSLRPCTTTARAGPRTHGSLPLANKERTCPPPSHHVAVRNQMACRLGTPQRHCGAP